MINSVTEVTEGSIIEVVLNTQPLGDEDVEIRPHSLSIHSYKTPTFCDFCREMLFGMFKQVYAINCRRPDIGADKKFPIMRKYLVGLPFIGILFRIIVPDQLILAVML